MAGITKREKEDKLRIASIKRRLEEDMPLYTFQRLNSTLTALQRAQDKRLAERKAKVEAARAARAEAAPKNYNVLPWNHRGPDPNAPPAPLAPVDPPGEWIPMA